MKKLIASIVALILFLSLALPVQNVNAQRIFSDVPTTHSNYEDITYLLNEGVINQSSKYGISDIVTREEVAVMIAKAVGLDGTQRVTKFKDVPQSNKNSGYIQSAVEAGIINGYDDGTFKPNAKVTRGHMAAFISRAFDLSSGAKSFSDVKPGHTAFEAVSQLAAAGITTGYEDGTFKPSNNLTRAHISAFLARAMHFADSESPVTVPPTKPVASKMMKVHFIDVGQGDSTLIQLATGENILVDGGTKAAGDDVVAYLKSLGLSKLDYVVATHPDADHVGGLIEVLNSFKVDTFMNSGKEHTTETYYELLSIVDGKNIEYLEPEQSDVFAYDRALDSYLQVLYTDATATDNNDASIVLKTGLGAINFLLMADAGTDVESKLVRTFDTVQADILKAGHHGSSTSSSLSFLQAVKPKATILSYGTDNSYGHPHGEALANLKAAGSKIYSTAQDGTIVVTTDGKTYSVTAKEFVTPVKTEPVKVEEKPTERSLYKNCTELRQVYPDGVQIGHAAYDVKHDGDGDGWACEPYVESNEENKYDFDYEEEESTPEPSKTYKNCTELNKDYPKGVSSDHPAYQSKMDRDGDGYACE